MYQSVSTYFSIGRHFQHNYLIKRLATRKLCNVDFSTPRIGFALQITKYKLNNGKIPRTNVIQKLSLKNTNLCWWSCGHNKYMTEEKYGTQA